LLAILGWLPRRFIVCVGIVVGGLAALMQPDVLACDRPRLAATTHRAAHAAAMGAGLFGLERPSCHGAAGMHLHRLVTGTAPDQDDPAARTAKQATLTGLGFAGQLGTGREG